MKTFYCAEDIERLAAQGKTELAVDENTVLTDLARDTARRLGISLKRVQVRPVEVVPATPVSALAVGATMNIGAKPRGCQHGPLDGGQIERAAVSGGSGAVVDQLVDLVKRLDSE